MHDWELGVGGEAPYVVGQREAFEEAIFLGLRLVDGVEPSRLEEEFGAEWVREVDEAIGETVEGGLMERTGSANAPRWRLTGRGRLLSNEVFTRLLMGVVV